jgi:hypothetical protein
LFCFGGVNNLISFKFLIRGANEEVVPLPQCEANGCFNWALVNTANAAE